MPSAVKPLAWESDLLLLVADSLRRVRSQGRTSQAGEAAQSLRRLRKSYQSKVRGWYDVWLMWHCAEFDRFHALARRVPRRNRNRRRWLHLRIARGYVEHDELAAAVRDAVSQVIYGIDFEFSSYLTSRY